MPSFTASQKLGVQPTVTPQYLETARAKDETGKQRVADSLLAEEIAKKDKDFATMWAKRREGGDEAATGLLNYYTYGDPNYGKQAQPAQYQFTQNDAAGYFNNPDEILKQLNVQSPETRIPGAFPIEQQGGGNPVTDVLSGAGKMAFNAGAGVVNITKGLASAAAHPVQTVSGLARGAVGAGELAYEKITGNQVPEFNPDGTTTPVADTQNQKVAKGIWDELVTKRYGSLDAAKKTAFEDPVGVIADILTVVQGGKALINAGKAGAGSKGVTAAQRAMADNADNLSMVSQAQIAERGLAEATRATDGGATAAAAAKASKGSGVAGAAPLAALGKAIKLPFKGAQKIGQGAASAGKEILGYATGAGRGAIDETLRTARMGTPEGIAAMKEGVRAGSINEAGTLNDVISSLEKARDIRAQQYQTKLSALSESTNPIDGTLVAKTLAEQAKKFKITRDENGAFKFSTTNFPEGSQAATEITRYMEEILSWGKEEGQTMDAVGLDTLKKRLSNIFPEDPAAAAFAAPVQDTIESLLNKVPGYKEMTTQYREFSNVLTDVKKTLSVGGTANRDTAIRKLTNLLKNNHENKQEVLRTLLETTGDTTTMPKIAGVSMANTMPRGIAGVLQSVNLSMNAFDIGRLAGRLGTLIVSSPRVAHEFLKVLGLTQRQVDKVIELGRKAGLGKLFNDEMIGIGGQVGRVNEAAKKKEQVEKLFPVDTGQNQ